MKDKQNNWRTKGMSAALRVFHATARRVPAYAHFLKTQGVNPRSIRTAHDFKRIPVADRDNYINRYPFDALCWDGTVSQGGLIVSSTGTMGEPLFWPRYAAQHHMTADVHEIILKDIFNAHRTSTLAVVCFSMGVHIAGMVTTLALQQLCNRGYPLCVMSPGIKMDAIVRSIQKMAFLFGQVILIGYPPYIKDVLENGAREGIDWKHMRVRFLFAAEGFSEGWRDVIHRMVGASDEYATTINVYGCADAGVLGYETPLSIFVRRTATRHAGFAHALTGVRTELMPPLYQYQPSLCWFEAEQGELMFTAATGIPLIRYNIHDRGGIIPYEQVAHWWRKKGETLETMMHKLGHGHFLNGLPFVYIHGRTNDAVTLYGLNIFPEHLKAAVESSAALREQVTGKFVMRVVYNAAFDQVLEIKLELRERLRADEELAVQVQKELVAGLRGVNVEYNALCESIGAKAYPVVELRPFRDEEYFALGIKHKWKK